MKFEDLTKDDKRFAALIGSMDEDQLSRFISVAAYLENHKADEMIKESNSAIDLGIGLFRNIDEARIFAASMINDSQPDQDSDRK